MKYFINGYLLALIAANGFAASFAFVPRNFDSGSLLVATSLGSPLTRYESISNSIKDPVDIPSAIRQERDGVVDARVDEILPDEILKQVELEAQKAVDEMLEEECEVDDVTGGPKDEICLDGEKREGVRANLKNVVGRTLQLIQGSSAAAEDEMKEELVEEEVPEGEVLERGWEKRASAGAIVRNTEIWKVALKCVFRALKPRKMRAKGASDEEIRAAQLEAAEYIRDNMLKLGPSFVKVSIYFWHSTVTRFVPFFFQQ